MTKEQNKTRSLAIYTLDLLATGLAFLCAYGFRGVLPQDSERILFPLSRYLNLLWLILPIWSLLFYLMDLYRYWRGEGFWRESWIILKAIFLSSCLLGLFIFALKYLFVSRIFIVSFAFFDLVLVILFRSLLRKAIQFSTGPGEEFRSIVIVGLGNDALTIAQGIENQGDMGVRIRGFLSPPDSHPPSEINGYPILGGAQDLPQLLEREAIDEVIFAVSQDELKKVENLLLACEGRGITIFPLNRDQGQPRLSIILVNYNTVGFLLSCLRSIEQCLQGFAHQVIVVDNHSQDNSWHLLRKEFPRLILIGNPSNLGFGRAVNQGFRMAQGKYILILNPDVTLLPGSVEKAIHFLEEHPEVALLLPKLLNPDGTLQLSCRRFPNFSAFLYRRTPLGKFFPNHKIIREHLMMDWEHDEAREVDWGMGACMFLRREDLKDQNIFDERFFLYFEDIDLCFRLKDEGRKVIYYPEAAMVHYHVRQSVRGLITINWAKWELYKSVFKFFFKHRTLRTPIPNDKGTRTEDHKGKSPKSQELSLKKVHGPRSTGNERKIQGGKGISPGI
jgi:GT2 family glycosyltransferase